MRLSLTLASAGLLALAASAAPAQAPSGNGAGRPPFAERRAQALFKDITLSPEQQAKVDSIQTRYRAELPAFTPGSPPDPATRQKMREVLRRQDDEIRALLTPDQQKLWDRNVAELRARRRGGP